MLDKLTRRTLRSSVAKYGGLPYAGTEIKGIRSYERAGGATWPNSDVFVKLLIQTKYPKLATNPKHAKAGRDLFTLIFSYYRLGLPAAQIAKGRRMRLKTLESQLQRLEALAETIIYRGHMRAENGESFFPTWRKTSPARNLVKNFQVVTNHPSDLNFLMSLADLNIQYQVLRVLAELAEQRQELHTVYDQDFQRLAA
jgi:hypothetical protein